MRNTTTTLLQVAKVAHWEGNRNVRTDGAPILWEGGSVIRTEEGSMTVEGFRNGFVTVYRRGIGPEFIHPYVAERMRVIDLGRAAGADCGV